MDTESNIQTARKAQLRSALNSTAIFRSLDATVLADLEAELEWVTLTSGETLIRQGDPGDCLYVVVSGRLRVVLEEDGKEVRVFREVGRGESIGEMALVTGEKRTATIYATRDAEVARLSQESFDRLLERHPQAVTKSFTRAIIQSLNQQLSGEKPGINAHITVAVVPASPDVLLSQFTERLVAALTTLSPTLHLSSRRVDAHLGEAGIAQDDMAVWDATDSRLLGWLSEQETKYRHIVYETDPTSTAWTRRCLRQADQILIVAHSTSQPKPGALEMELLHSDDSRARKRTSLVLLHRNGQQMPVGTRHWLAARQVEQHHHLRWDTEADFGRLARFVAGRAVGLALGGGGARCFAHIGVIRALAEAGVPIDAISGTSAGALIGAQCAMGWDHETILRQTRRAIQSNTNDYTVPYVSLLAGYKVSAGMADLFGSTHIDDLWLPFFCVSTNLTQADVMVHRDDLLWQGVRASNGLPGLLPPVIHEGDALIDGGLLDNLPMGVMRDICGSGTVIAVDVAPPVDLAEIAQYGAGLSGWHALQSRFTPWAAKLNVPNLLALLLRAVEVGTVYALKSQLKQQIADLYLRQPVEAFGLMEYAAIEEIAAIGYQHTSAQIAAWWPDHDKARRA